MPPETHESIAARCRRIVSWVLRSEQGIRSGWLALAFVAIYQGLTIATTPVVGRLISLTPTGPISPTLALIRESWEVLLVLSATRLMARVEKRPILSFGYGDSRGGMRLLTGTVWGFLTLSLLIGVLWTRGSLVFDGAALGGLTACEYALAWALVFLLVGVLEESLLRGYLQFTLARSLGFWWTALLLSAVFAWMHTHNTGESPLGLLSVGAGGLIFCLSLWYTKSLWWAIGFHAGWDWGQSFFYGVPNSGWIMKGHFLAAHATGDPLYSGGSAGPEASLYLLPLLILMAAGMRFWWHGQRSPQGKHAPERG
jgi:membrane protease YdiL (CAAX protease family)